MDSSSETIEFTESSLQAYCAGHLSAAGLSRDHVEAMVKFIVAGQRDECHSHGVYRLLTCLDSMQSGKVQRTAAPAVRRDGPVTKVDAGFGFSPLAFRAGLPCLVEAARHYGVGLMAINHCFHFSALWTEIEELTGQGLAALAMNPSHAVVAPAGGHEPTFGTNPIAFGWPRPGPYPYVFDFATSSVARGEVELHRRARRALPEGCGVDSEGRPTTDPEAVLRGAMLTFGGHKGSALSTMIELLGGALIGDWTSQESVGFESRGAACHGELVIAFDPLRLGDDQGVRRAESLFGSISSQGARLPSERRFAARRRSELHGIRVPRALIEEIDERFGVALAESAPPVTVHR
jgi:LDH2 family malate/lactate/ureidoglycolate dehydrogenase